MSTIKVIYESCKSCQLGTGKSESESHVWFFQTPWTIVHGILQDRILEWVAVPFSRDRTQVFCIAGRFFTSLATMEAQEYWSG